MKIAEGQHTPYQIAVGKTDYQVRCILCVCVCGKEANFGGWTCMGS